MSTATVSQSTSSRADAVQALTLMFGAVLMGAAFASDGSSLVLGVISFCLFLMIMIAGSLFFIESRIETGKPDPMLKFCIPAIGLLGFSEAFAVAGGFWIWAGVVLIVAFAFAAYRRARTQGPFNLIPSAALDLGVVAGVGASAAGLILAIAHFVAT